MSPHASGRPECHPKCGSLSETTGRETIGENKFVWFLWGLPRVLLSAIIQRVNKLGDPCLEL